MEQLIAGFAIIGFACLFMLLYALVAWSLKARCPQCRSKRTAVVNKAKFYESWKCSRCGNCWDIRISKEDSIYG